MAPRKLLPARLGFPPTLSLRGHAGLSALGWADLGQPASVGAWPRGPQPPRGRWCCCCCCCARLLLSCVVLATAGSLSVEMPGRSQIAYVNDNVTLSCQVPGCPILDTRIMGVTWYRKDLVSEAEVKVFELYGDQQKAFRRGAMVSAQKLKRGDASLRLPGVGLGDAGEYRCELTVTPQKAKGWVLLEVLAKPAITLKKPMVKSNGTHLVCQSSGFSPESISITWVKWTQKAPQSQRISKDNFTGPTVKNEDGVVSITSYLKLNASLEDNGTIYQCVVEYPSLSISQRVNFTLPVIEAEKIHLSLFDKRFIWYFALIFLILFLVLRTWKHACKADGGTTQQNLIPVFKIRKRCCYATSNDETTEETTVLNTSVVYTYDSSPSCVSTSTSVAP